MPTAESLPFVMMLRECRQQHPMRHHEHQLRRVRRNRPFQFPKGPARIHRIRIHGCIGEHLLAAIARQVRNRLIRCPFLPRRVAGGIRQMHEARLQGKRLGTAERRQV